MRWRLSSIHSRALAVALLLLLIGAIGTAIALPGWRMHQRYDSFIADYADKTSRYRRIADMRPGIESAIKKVQEQNGRRRYLKSNNPALAAAELQERVARIIESSGARAVSTNILPSKDEGNFRRIGLSIQLNSTIIPLQQFLYALEAQEHAVLVDFMAIRSSAGRTYKPLPGVQPEFSVQINVYSYAVINPA